MLSLEQGAPRCHQMTDWIEEDDAMSESSQPVEFGCDFCADDQNRLYGHLVQVGSNETRRTILLRCPRCNTLYENTAVGADETRRLTEVQAEQLYPGV
jgi:hypothetical protein